MMNNHSQSPGGASASWDDHYRRKGRTRERFDYAHTSEELSPELPQEYTTPGVPTSAGRHSADSRPQYHHRPAASVSGTSSRGGGSVSTNSSKNRATCMNMFYPGETGDMGPPPSTVMSDTNFQYYSQEQERLTYDASLGNAYHNDDLAYSPSRQQLSSSQYEKESGRSLTPTRLRYGNASSSDVRRTIDYATGTGYYQSRNAPARQTMNSRPQSDQYYKENLLMYGEGLQDAPSASTGLSQEELLQRKRREETWRKRKEKRQQNKQRVVNLPSSLFSTHSSRQQQQQRYVAPQPAMYGDIDMENEAIAEERIPVTRNSAQVAVPPVEARRVHVQSADRDTTRDVNDVPGGGKGVRGMMVSQMLSFIDAC